jgi:His-Xaa-Ser system radical SAM maturase HxsB
MHPDDIVHLRSRTLAHGTLYTATSGRFFLASNAFRDRLVGQELGDEDRCFLERSGCLPEGMLASSAAKLAAVRRQAHAATLDYLILVPTLRCNLSCSYCQVSRADEGASGFDWTEVVRDDVVRLVRTLEAPSVKIEFQGGEPTLRPDLIEDVIASVPRHLDASFVICTNLERIDDRLLSLFDRQDVTISTSLDGDAATHRRQRPPNRTSSVSCFEENLAFLLQRYGPRKISALPTIDPVAPPDIDGLIDAYAARGFSSIYLRPINYQGFARKRHAASRGLSNAWQDYHKAFILRLIARNWTKHSDILEETYFSLLLRRIFRPSEDRHVDLRNPNPIGRDYIVVDHDGRVFPTDEARMLTRAGVIDLAIGDIAAGWDSEARHALDTASTNVGDPACETCVYQPYCGRDLIDDIARYGRIDMPRHETAFCQRHMHLFDLAFTLVHSDDPAVAFSLRRWLGLSGDTVALGYSR